MWTNFVTSGSHWDLKFDKEAGAVTDGWSVFVAQLIRERVKNLGKVMRFNVN